MAMTYGQSNVENKYYDIFIRKTGATIQDLEDWEVGGSAINTGYLESFSETDVAAQKWCKMGVNESAPSMITSDGDTVELNTQDTIVLSKGIEVLFNVLNLSKANIEELQVLAKVDYDLDLMFVERGTGEVTGYLADSMNLSINFEINTLRKAPCKANKSHGRKQNGFVPISVTYA